MYRIEYLPLAKKDIGEIMVYIADTLESPKVAMELLNSFDKSISKLERFPYMCKVYHTVKPMENEYRLLPVKNYGVFYIVKENTLEIHRIVYAKMDLHRVIR